MQFTSLLAAGSSLVALASANPTNSLMDRSIAAKGGWSLSAGVSACPARTSSCFTDQTGLQWTENRMQNCCPVDTVPELYCGTYVNTGQPYACCPIENPDCRGDVEQGNSTSVCANSGWAKWYVPEYGFNAFCCLPGQYGYYFPELGQDAVGQCYDQSLLPMGSMPAVQVNNGDGSVDGQGNQLTTLPMPVTPPAPVCDIIHYGWSLQTSDGTCTPGSHMCPTGGACCPNSLQCGTVVGDSEVPVCCPADNPDCRGDVEGLWPQLCADSSWALWHVNTNGNHFCCKPGQVGYNVPGNNSAVGYCGSGVPLGDMRSIYDYPGDGSTPGSNENYPCDSNPYPNNTLPSIVSAILNPAPTLNPGGGSKPSQVYYANVTTSYLPTNSVPTKPTVTPQVEGVLVTVTEIDGVLCTTTMPRSVATSVPFQATASPAAGSGSGASAAGAGPASSPATSSSSSKTTTASGSKFTGGASTVGISSKAIGGVVALLAVAFL